MAVYSPFPHGQGGVKLQVPEARRQFFPAVRDGDGAVIQLGEVTRRGPQRAAGLDGHVRDENAECRQTALDPVHGNETLSPPVFALIVYRLGQEILNLQSGVRFPVGAPISEESLNWEGRVKSC